MRALFSKNIDVMNMPKSMFLRRKTSCDDKDTVYFAMKDPAGDGYRLYSDMLFGGSYKSKETIATRYYMYEDEDTALWYLTTILQEFNLSCALRYFASQRLEQAHLVDRGLTYRKGADQMVSEMVQLHDALAQWFTSKRSMQGFSVFYGSQAVVPDDHRGFNEVVSFLIGADFDVLNSIDKVHAAIEEAFPYGRSKEPIISDAVIAC